MPASGARLGSLAFAGGLELPYIVVGTRHHRGARAGVGRSEKALLRHPRGAAPSRARCVFTDTFAETNGVAGTMRRLAAAGARGG